METQNFKTPIEKIFFRSSKNGLLAGGLIRHGLTEKQRFEMDSLEAAKVTPVGLSEKQQAELDSWNKKVEEGATLSQTQSEKRDEYKARLKRPKGLTDKQEEKLQELKERNAKKPELSQGAKTQIKQVWLENEKGFKEEVTDKKLRKSLQAEEDAINLISFVDKVMYVKNETRIYKDNRTGECDVVTTFKNMKNEAGEDIGEVKVIDDTKCSWNPRTFMNAELTTGYEWQGRDYLNLYDADIFRLRHCLVNCPPEVFQDEYKKFCFQNSIIDDTVKEYEELIKQFIVNYIYDLEALNFDASQYPETVVRLCQDITFNYTQKERVKTFAFERDFELESFLLNAVELAVQYYKTITLNMIEEC